MGLAAAVSHCVRASSETWPWLTMDWDQFGIPCGSQGLTNTWRAVAGFPETGLQAMFGPVCQFWGCAPTAESLCLVYFSEMPQTCFPAD